VRVTTAFKRLLRLPGASVVDVSFGTEGVVVTVRLRRRRRVCEDVPLAVELRDGDPVSELSQAGVAATSGAAVGRVVV
jgi:hypothetical protein